jgi:NAD(P)-dependent dehydrogenase (short-subunit alcohol dehydrogenase family)
LSGRLGRQHILVNAIAPGSFQSKMMADTLKNFGDQILQGIPTGRIGTPEDIVGTCIYLSSRAGQYTLGAVIVVDGGAIQNTARI